MTLAELGLILKTTDLPVAYLAFDASEAPTMPFIVFQETGSDNFGADNIVWFSGTRVQVDLLCIRRSRSTEELLENALTNNGIYWERVVDFDDNENYYRSTYEIVI